MPINKKQLKRMVKFVASLRKDEYPNRSSFVKKLEQHDINNNENISCSAKTIQRDIKSLIEEFGAPIEFDQENNGYFLTRSDWKFRCPIFQEDELLALAIGSCVAGKIFPEPIKTDIQDAFDYQLSENNYDGGFDHLEQLMISSGLNVQIPPDIFNKVYKAWKDRYCIKMIYTTPGGSESERIIEPQLLAFHNRAWMVKAYCHQRKEARNFAVHRIKSIEILEERFKYKKEFSADAQGGTIFNFNKVEDIELQCCKSILPYVIEQPLHHDQKVLPDSTDLFTIALPDVMEQEIVQWVLSQQGKATVVKPAALKQTIADRARDILDKHYS